MTAAIVETRINYQLPSIIDQHMKFLPEGTELFMFTNEAGFSYYLKHCPKAQFVVIKDINNLNDYNRFMTSTTMWNILPDGHCLIFQHDSMMLRLGIEEFFKYDYCGAPWKFQHHGGNGGYSLRRVEAMRYYTSEYKWNPSLGYEDVWLSNLMINDETYQLAPREVCRKFSCETIFELGTLGVHAISKYLNKDQCNQILTQYD